MAWLLISVRDGMTANDQVPSQQEEETRILVWIVVGGIVAGSVHGLSSFQTIRQTGFLSTPVDFGLVARFVLFGLALRGDLAALREAIHAAMDARCPGQRWRAASDAWERGEK